MTLTEELRRAVRSVEAEWQLALVTDPGRPMWTGLSEAGVLVCEEELPLGLLPSLSPDGLFRLVAAHRERLLEAWLARRAPALMRRIEAGQS